MNLPGKPTSSNRAGNGRRRFCRGCPGFTLAEVLAALFFMALVIPVAMEGLSVASRAGTTAVRRSEAALVAERLLQESVVTTNWSTAVQSGVVRQGARDFRWSMRNEPWNGDANSPGIRLLSVEVSYAVQGQDQVLSLSTLVDSTSPLDLTNSY